MEWLIWYAAISGGVICSGKNYMTENQRSVTTKHVKWFIAEEKERL
jgi:hypothetical protein